MFDQLVAGKYSMHSTLFSPEENHCTIIGLDQPVAGNTDGFVQGIINNMERMYASKQQRSNSLNT
jgi:hypothetical protein